MTIWSSHSEQLAAQAPRRELDVLMIAVVGLCSLGLVLAVSVQGVATGGPLLAMKAQGWKLLFAFAALLLAAAVPMTWLARHALKLFVVAVGLCLVAALVGHFAKGATRWIRWGPVSFQPVELGRLLLILVTARALALAGPRLREFRAGFLPVVAAASALAAVLAIQPDFGNALIVMTIAACMALIAGVRLLWFLLCGLPLLGVLVLVMSERQYVHGRMIGFLNAEPGSQVHQSMLAIGSGGWFGRGLGGGWMKMGYVPESSNDFVFAILGEELGFCGGLLVLTLYGLIGWAGFRLVLRMQDPFLRYTVFGLTFALLLQAMINLFVVTGMAPAKGIDLPFLSSGGTNLVFSLAAVGLIGNAARIDQAGVSLHRE